MKCPNCNETLLMTQRNNIEIDYCPSCRGVWLDKGELDKMIAHEMQSPPFEKPVKQSFGRPGEYNAYGKHPHGYNKPYKKKSFLGDLFDFD